MSGYRIEEDALARIVERSGHARVVTRDADPAADLSVLCGALQSVLRVHRPAPVAVEQGQTMTCAVDGGPWPCETRRVIRDELNDHTRRGDHPAYLEGGRGFGGKR